MVSLQSKIDDIVLSADSLSIRIAKLKQLMTQEGVTIVSDFDDTIADERSLFSVRFQLALMWDGVLRVFHGKKHSPIIQNSARLERMLKKSFRPNTHFFALMQKQNITGKMVILSRNNHFLVRHFASAFAHIFAPHNIECVWAIGRTGFLGLGKFRFKSSAKLDFLPPNSLFIGDAFESKQARKHVSFRAVLPLVGLDRSRAFIRKIPALLLLVFGK